MVLPFPVDLWRSHVLIYCDPLMLQQLCGTNQTLRRCIQDPDFIHHWQLHCHWLTVWRNPSLASSPSMDSNPVVMFSVNVSQYLRFLWTPTNADNTSVCTGCTHEDWGLWMTSERPLLKRMDQGCAAILDPTETAGHPHGCCDSCRGDLSSAGRCPLGTMAWDRPGSEAGFEIPSELDWTRDLVVPMPWYGSYPYPPRQHLPGVPFPLYRMPHQEVVELQSSAGTKCLVYRKLEDIVKGSEGADTMELGWGDAVELLPDPQTPWRPLPDTDPTTGQSIRYRAVWYPEVDGRAQVDAGDVVAWLVWLQKSLVVLYHDLWAVTGQLLGDPNCLLHRSGMTTHAVWQGLAETLPPRAWMELTAHWFDPVTSSVSPSTFAAIVQSTWHPVHREALRVFCTSPPYLLDRQRARLQQQRHPVAPSMAYPSAFHPEYLRRMGGSYVVEQALFERDRRLPPPSSASDGSRVTRQNLHHPYTRPGSPLRREHLLGFRVFSYLRAHYLLDRMQRCIPVPTPSSLFEEGAHKTEDNRTAEFSDLYREMPHAAEHIPRIRECHALQAELRGWWGRQVLHWLRWWAYRPSHLGPRSWRPSQFHEPPLVYHRDLTRVQRHDQRGEVPSWMDL